jgi:thiamine-monophosphate kinase
MKRMTRESELHERIYQRSRDMGARFARVVVGPGDDCAVVRVGPDARADGPSAGPDGSPLELLTVDQVVEGRHFVAGTPVDLIARKVVARSISDIAAMGGTPRWALATGVLPDGYAHAAELTDALHRWGEHWGAPMVGGDIASSPRGTPLVLTVTVGGAPHDKRGPVLRSGARAGDEVWLTGALGGSLASGRHLSFEPRVAEGAWLCDTLGEALHAMIDVSDGLGRDTGRIAAASGVRMEIEGASVPRHADVAEVMAALRDGEDYELCFVTAAGAALPARTPQGTAMTRIGRVAARKGGAGCVAKLEGREIDVSNLGWDHGA